MGDIVLVEGSNQLNVGMVPIVAPGVTITGVTWTSADRSYTNYWGDSKTAKFYGGTVTITSDAPITGKVTITLPGFISSVRLMTEAEYQELLAWLDDMIASSTGSTLELYVARKAIALTFPKIDGFREDYRWVSDHNKEFYTKIQEEANNIEYTCDLVAGDTSIPIAFYQLEDTGLITIPAIISVYTEDGTLLASVQSSLPGAAEAPVVAENVFITPTTPGGEYRISAEITIRRFTSQQVTLISFEPDISLVVDEVYSVSGLVRWIDGSGRFAIINQPVEATYVARRRGQKIDIPIGTYPVKAQAQIWRGYTYPTVNGYGVMLYGDVPLVFYDLGVVGTLIIQ